MNRQVHSTAKSMFLSVKYKVKTHFLVYIHRVIGKECILCLGNETDAEPGETQAQK